MHKLSLILTLTVNSHVFPSEKSAKNKADLFISLLKVHENYNIDLNNYKTKLIGTISETHLMFLANEQKKTTSLGCSGMFHKVFEIYQHTINNSICQGQSNVTLTCPKKSLKGSSIYNILD